MKGLSSGVSTARKLYRFGKTLDFVRKLQQLKFVRAGVAACVAACVGGPPFVVR